MEAVTKLRNQFKYHGLFQALKAKYVRDLEAMTLNEGDKGSSTKNSNRFSLKRERVTYF